MFNQGKNTKKKSIEWKEKEREIFRSDVALIYNDRAVLENHHVSAAFRLMRIDDYNIVAEFTSEEYK